MQKPTCHNIRLRLYRTNVTEIVLTKSNIIFWDANDDLDVECITISILCKISLKFVYHLQIGNILKSPHLYFQCCIFFYLLYPYVWKYWKNIFLNISYLREFNNISFDCSSCLRQKNHMTMSLILDDKVRTFKRNTKMFFKHQMMIMTMTTTRF